MTSRAVAVPPLPPDVGAAIASELVRLFFDPDTPVRERIGLGKRLLSHVPADAWDHVRPSEPAAEPCEPPPDEQADETASVPLRRTEPRVGRNARCPCGSGRKYKACCGPRRRAGPGERGA